MRKIVAGLVSAGLALALAACGSDAAPADSVYANQEAMVGISMPNETSERWINDGNQMADQFKAMGYQVDLKFAADDAAKQSSQLQAMIDEDAKLLVVSAFDGGALGDVLAKAAAKNIPVIAYDRLLTGTKDVSYQATFDNERVGVMQANLLVDKLKLGSGGNESAPKIELFAGSPTDSNAKSFYDGSMSVLKPYIRNGDVVVGSGETRFKPITTEKYDGKIAGERMTTILGKYYSDSDLVDGILSPYDGMTRGVIDALKADGYGTESKPLPVTSGQDAELDSVKSIIAGEQTATIFKDTRELAKVAVQQGNALLTGTTPIVNDTETYDNGVKTVPTYLLYPVAVDKSNYNTLLIKSGYLDAGELVG